MRTHLLCLFGCLMAWHGSAQNLAFDQATYEAWLDARIGDGSKPVSPSASRIGR